MSEPDHHAVYEALRQRNKVADVDLSGLSFDEGAFESANFDNCAGAGARFVGGELASSTWKSCRFAKCQFSNMSFSGARFEDCHASVGPDNDNAGVMGRAASGHGMSCLDDLIPVSGQIDVPRLRRIRLSGASQLLVE